MDINGFIHHALKEDIGEGDHTSIACIPQKTNGKAQLKVKENCVIAGVALAEKIFRQVSSLSKFSLKIPDGKIAKKGDVAFEIEGNAREILSAERLVLNCMQRMSGIATITYKMVEEIKGTKAKILDTRKTTPNFRVMEKWAVKIGGGENHRFGLFDMILIKDNHIDLSGGISNALTSVKNYVAGNKNIANIKIEIEARSIQDIKEILDSGGVNRILLDNFSIDQTREAVKIIDHTVETESSGNITIENIRAYAECGVDFISVGALTHSSKSIDLSLKATF